jgi:protein-S-isoprenylcysteine O-methyltransferase Ste14
MNSLRAYPFRVHALELRVPPLVVLLVAGAFAWLIARAIPSLHFELPVLWAVASGLFCAGVTLSVAGVGSFRRAKTTVNPIDPTSSTALVVSGIYRVTRNPMYLGFLLILAGATVLMENAATFLVLPAFVLYLNRFQIRAEEVALQSRFGDAFVIYRSRVRRWL